MADGPPPAKKGRLAAPAARVTTEERVKQFPEMATERFCFASFAIVVTISYEWTRSRTMLACSIQ